MTDVRLGDNDKHVIIARLIYVRSRAFAGVYDVW